MCVLFYLTYTHKGVGYLDSRRTVAKMMSV